MTRVWSQILQHFLLPVHRKKTTKEEGRPGTESQLPQIRSAGTGNFLFFKQCCGAVPDSMGSQDPDPYPGGQKGPTKIEKVNMFQFLKHWMFSSVLWNRNRNRRNRNFLTSGTGTITGTVTC
jgi:hypothetical protein